MCWSIWNNSLYLGLRWPVHSNFQQHANIDSCVASHWSCRRSRGCKPWSTKHQFLSSVLGEQSLYHIHEENSQYGSPKNTCFFFKMWLILAFLIKIYSVLAWQKLTNGLVVRFFSPVGSADKHNLAFLLTFIESSQWIKWKVCYTLQCYFLLPVINISAGRAIKNSQLLSTMLIHGF